MALSKMSQLAVCAASGVVFGFAAEKAHVYVPSVIVNQMSFSQFTMLKMFLSAVIAGLGIFSLLYTIPGTRRYLKNARDNFSGCIRTQTLMSALLGGAILGMGMTIAGSCPGMIFIQLGTGTQNALYTLAGCLSGVLVYSVVDGYLFNQPTVPKPAAQQQQQMPFLDKASGVSYTSLTIPFAALLIAVVATVEYFIPWTSEVPVTGGPLLMQRTWSPILGGLILGSLQLPLSWAVSDTLGGSSSYCSLTAQLLGPTGLLKTDALRYLSSFQNGMSNWWQVVYVGGALVGGATSAFLSGTLATTVGVAPLPAFVGGFCLVFGSRLASGCTSGHGLSGMGLLSITSFLTVAAMFGGGISLALIMKQF